MNQEFYQISVFYRFNYHTLSLDVAEISEFYRFNHYQLSLDVAGSLKLLNPEFPELIFDFEQYFRV